MTGIKQNWENGIIRVHELGRGMKLLFPSVAFFLCRWWFSATQTSWASRRKLLPWLHI